MLGVGRGADNHTMTKKNIVMKSEEVKTRPICQGGHRKGLKDLRVGSWNVLWCRSRYENIRDQELEESRRQQR
jgi:hypothetical protein